MFFHIRAAGSDLGGELPDDGSSKLVYEQPFTLYVALFVNGMPVPPGFTMLA